jgi:hypothetical protein
MVHGRATDRETGLAPSRDCGLAGTLRPCEVLVSSTTRGYHRKPLCGQITIHLSSERWRVWLQMWFATGFDSVGELD